MKKPAFAAAAALLRHTPALGPSGPFRPRGGAVTSPNNNLVPLDAAHSVMNITGGMAINGTWKLKSDAGATLTQFGVLVWGGSAVTLANDLVVLFPDNGSFIYDMRMGLGIPGLELETNERTQGELYAVT